jgi:hypothetical protein
LTPVDRQDLLVLEVVLVGTGDDPSLVLESDDQWPGETC